ncbi:uncharacterized protein LOC112568348 isoform X2 [Pomacea canaliculata]|uniref:uncharacterized protein LOC112568348 isoform X2 n=1 Tax=Pomacea canaliculata TaxID=400727 RepID=UPI000D7398A8|nr:uncharacterized protein LOC112568348 isoform X2 [Pomacea canaliculata]
MLLMPYDEVEEDSTGIIMRVVIVVTIIVALQCCCLTLGQLTDSRIKCSAPAAELTKEATVTCLFPHDIRQKKTDFIVRHNETERQRGQNGTHQMKTVANCMWFNGKLDCTMQTGYKHEEQDVTSTNFTLRIPHFLQNHTGQYFCEVDGQKFEICLLLHHTDVTTPRATGPKESVTTSLLIIIVSTTGAAITLASVAVIVYIAYRCYQKTKRERRTNNIRMTERGEQESQNLVDGGQSERTPTPETNGGQHADVITRLLSDVDRSVLHRCCFSIQQEQMNGQCSQGKNRGIVCDCSRHSPAPAGYVTLGNHGKCGGSDVMMSVQGKSVCCEGCPTMRQSKVTTIHEHKLDDILDDDRMFSYEESSPKKEQMNTPGKNAFYSTCHVCQDKIKVLHWGQDIDGHKGYTVSEEANHSHHDDKVLVSVRVRDESESTLRPVETVHIIE